MLNSNLQFMAVSADIITVARQMHTSHTVHGFLKGFAGADIRQQQELLKMLFTLNLVDGNTMANAKNIHWTIRKWF